MSSMKLRQRFVPTALAGFAFVCGALVVAMPVQAQTGSGGKDGSIDRCERNLGSLAVAEPQSQMLASLNQYKLGSPSTMLRMIAQESGCFTVVERGVAMQNIQQERSLAAGGMLQQDSNLGGGQLQAADFVLTPSLQFSDSTGGMGAAVGGLLGRMGGVLGALGGLAGGIKFNEAETTLLLADVRSGIQVASAQGQATKMDFSLGGWGWGGFGWASAGGYSKTPEGKLLAASLLDNFNRIVQQVRNKPALVQASSASSRANAQMSTRATTLAPALAPTTVVVQPVLAAAPLMAPGPVGLSSPPSLQMFARAAGTYSGRLSGEAPGSFTLQLTSDGMVGGMVQLENQPAFMLTGQLNNGNGDFGLMGSTGQDNVVAMGRFDLNQYTLQGQMFLSKAATGNQVRSAFTGKR